MNMRDILRLFEDDHLLAARIKAGPLVRAPWTLDPDLDDVIAPEERRLAWHSIVLPVSVVAPVVDLSLDPNPGCDEDEEAARFAAIRRWMMRSGGPYAALYRRPPAFVLNAHGLLCIDGRHRLAIARSEGLVEFPAIAAIATD